MMALSKELFNEIEDISVMKKIIENSLSKIPHLGSCLPCVDILIYLYWIEMSIDPSNHMI